MGNYYEILAVTPQANSEEISNAIGNHYNQVRRLINHHDPGVVNQANQALLVLEQMKIVLLDPQKKAEYDLSISTVGGLVDITAHSTNVTGQNNIGIGNIQNNLGGNVLGADGWICPKCQRSNPKGALFCQHCSEAIGRICPNCMTHYESKVAFCPSCGKSIDQAQKKSQLAQDLQNKQIRKRNISQKTFESAFPDARYFEFLSVGSLGWAILLGLTTVLFTLATLFKIILSFFEGAIFSSSGFSTLISVVSGINGFLLWVVWVGVLGFFYYLIKKRGIKVSLPALAGYGVLSLFAMLFQGRSLIRQVYGGYANQWLLFLSLIAAVIVGLGGYLFSKNPEVINTPEINKPFYKKIESYVKQLFSQFNNSVWTVTGFGIAVALLVMIFSPSRALLIGLIAGIFGFAVSILLFVVAFRSNRSIENQKVKFISLQKSESQEVIQLDNEIEEIQKQIRDLG